MDLEVFSFFLSFISLLSGNDTAIAETGNPSTDTKNTSIFKFVSDRTRQIVNATKFRRTTTSTTIPPTLPLTDLQRLCPSVGYDPIDSSWYRYDNSTRACYKIGQHHPICGENQFFYARDEDDTFGECGCATDQTRLLIFSGRHNRCYFIFEQAFCGKREWLDIDRDGRPICTRNPCYSFLQRLTKKDLVLFNGKCVEVGKPADGCDADEIVGFRTYRRQPTCINKIWLGNQPASRGIGVPRTPCSPGSYRALGGSCSPPFDFD